jgi:hypothetical protein
MGKEKGRTIIDDVKVSGMSINDGDKDATALVQVKYHWPGDWPGDNFLFSWMSPPCSLLNGEKQGILEVRMVYKKYDTGWHLEQITNHK